MRSFKQWLKAPVWKTTFPPVLYFVAATIFMTWPLALRMGDQVVGDIGDNVYFVWLFGWFRKALFELHISPDFSPLLNYPTGWSLAHTEITPATILMGLPASLVAGNIFAYNFVLLATFVLSGLGVYFWIVRLTQNRSAALIAGTIFAFIPYRMAHFLVGHLNLVGTEWFPLLFWGLFELLNQEKWSWKPVLLTGLSFGLIALTSMYYFAMAVVATLLIGTVYLLFFNRPRILRLDFWKGVGATALVALPLTLAAVAPFLQVNNSGDLRDRNIDQLIAKASSPVEYFLPSTDHFLWGRWVMLRFDRSRWVEGSMYIGAVSGALALLALIQGKKAPRPQKILIILMVLTGLVFFIFSLGPGAHWPEFTRIRALPRVFQWIQPLLKEQFTIILPVYPLVKYVPFFALMRAWVRFGLLTLLAVSILAGLGSAWLLGRVRPAWRTGLTVLILGLVFLDFYPGPYTTFSRLETRPVDAWLANQPGNGAVAQFPFSTEEDQMQVYFTQFYNKPFLGGFFNAFPPEQYLRIRPVMDTFPSPESVALLKSLNVEYVVVDTGAYPDFPAARAVIERLGLRPAVELEGQSVFLMPGK